ncbi:MAG: HIT family protein [Gammaproteobacteria bacterium]|nr:HIT family protein [Gammaproteobacteria bacterium]
MNNKTENTTCRFCGIPDDHPRMMIKGQKGFVLWDRNPASDGHCVAIPYRHFDNYFDINDEEVDELWSLVKQAKQIIEEKYHPDGYNIGINVGESAGQSVFHLHIHIIPRYKGDVENPRGGVRGVIPDKKLYS